MQELVLELVKNLPFLVSIGFGIRALHQRNKRWFFVWIVAGSVLSAGAIEIFEPILKDYTRTVEGFVINSIGFTVAIALFTAGVFKLEHKRNISRNLRVVAGVICLGFLAVLLVALFAGSASVDNQTHTVSTFIGIVAAVSAMFWQSRTEQKDLSRAKILLLWTGVTFVFSFGGWLIDYH